VTRRTVAQAGATAGTGAAGGVAGRGAITLVDDVARTPGLTSRMTAAERQALLEARASASMQSRIVGRDVLPGPVAPRISLEFTRSELARLHTPGANLTRTEIIKKAELYAARESARTLLQRARDNGASAVAQAPMREEFLRLNALIEQARAAARNLR
jgi:hypothetical protein